MLTDNIEWDEETGEIVTGCFPIGDENHHHGEVFTFKAPKGRPIVKQPQFKSLVRHSGKAMQSTSSGLQYGGALLVGSPGAPGLLWCPDETK